MKKKESLLHNVWKEISCNIDKSIEISRRYDIPHIISSIASQKDNPEEYLFPMLKNHFPDPFSVENMQEAVSLIEKHISNRILIFSDYDVDGSTSNAMLYKYLNKLNVNCNYYIPDRLKEGYGTSIEILKNIQTDLIIFLDCGTNASEEIEYLRSRGIDSLIIDHHIKKRETNCIMINYKNLCTAGLVLIFIVAMNTKFRILNDLNEYISLAAMGTICDLVPLIGFNRLIVKKGIDILDNNQVLKDIFNLKRISSYEIAFKIGPVLNAGSRMDDSSLATKFLISYSKEIADKLIELNKQRRTMQSIIWEKIITSSNNNKKNKFSLLYDRNWHKGIIGIIASKVVEKNNSTAFIGAQDDKEIVFSARSAGDVDISYVILQALEKKIIIKGGGHRMAGGFSIVEENIDSFKQIVEENINPKEEKTLEYNGNISILGIQKARKFLHYIEPVGMNNPPLIFKLLNLRLVSKKYIQEYLSSITFKDILENKINLLCTDDKLSTMIKDAIRYDLIISIREHSCMLLDAKITDT